jgi:hypothetical protein
MADYKLWNALKDAKKYRWVELSHSLNNESPYWSGIPEGSVELAKTVWDWGKPELECLIQTFKFPGQLVPISTSRVTSSRAKRCPKSMM